MRNKSKIIELFIYIAIVIFGVIMLFNGKQESTKPERNAPAVSQSINIERENYDAFVFDK